GDADGRPGGEPAGHGAQPRGRAVGPGARAAARQGRGPWSERRSRAGAGGGQDPRREGSLIGVATIDNLDATGKKTGSRELAPALFEAPVNVPLMHQVVVAGLASLRSGTHKAKTRGDVRGGGKKPWRQKGTGRARQGSIRAPQWTGGGVAHGPVIRDHDLRVNKKM